MIMNTKSDVHQTKKIANSAVIKVSILKIAQKKRSDKGGDRIFLT